MALYTAFYRLEREPFSLSPDPAFIYPSPSHREAIAQLVYAVQARRGLAMLSGEVGTGKTTLLRNLLDTMGSEVNAAYILNPPRTRAELYLMLAAELGFEPGAPESWTLALHRFLIETFSRGVTVVALFDEAQQMPREVLDEIRLLSNLETADTKLLQVVLAGQPELDAMVDSNEMRALKQRISLRHHLTALTLEECVHYVSTRLRRAGARELPFDMSACRAIHHYSHGIPRLINVLCDAAMLAGYAADCRIISAAMIKDAATDARLDHAEATRRRAAPVIELRPSDVRRPWRVRTAIATLVVLSLVVLYAAYPGRIDMLIGRLRSTIGSVMDHAGEATQNLGTRPSAGTPGRVSPASVRYFTEARELK